MPVATRSTIAAETPRIASRLRSRAGKVFDEPVVELESPPRGRARSQSATASRKRSVSRKAPISSDSPKVAVVLPSLISVEHPPSKGTSGSASISTSRKRGRSEQRSRNRSRSRTGRVESYSPRHSGRVESYGREEVVLTSSRSGKRELSEPAKKAHEQVDESKIDKDAGVNVESERTGASELAAVVMVILALLILALYSVVFSDMIRSRIFSYWCTRRLRLPTAALSHDTVSVLRDPPAIAARSTKNFPDGLRALNVECSRWPLDRRVINAILVTGIVPDKKTLKLAARIGNTEIVGLFLERNEEGIHDALVEAAGRQLLKTYDAHTNFYQAFGLTSVV
ncbi:hypothetical protein HDU93_004855 [Gonapodya sp. JEL0774]|nr:hypothetical protein HDU93_004855 [Gonapodya sp. JEL0774]